MRPPPASDLYRLRLDVQNAELELAELTAGLRAFEAEVDARLGSLLDQLSAVEAEVLELSEAAQRIRDQRLYGEKRFTYFDGARPTQRPEREYIPHSDAFGETPPAAAEPGPELPGEPGEIKALYRQLARATDRPGEADRQQRRLVAEINQAYAAGDLAALRLLAGLEPPPPAGGLFAPARPSPPLTEPERLQRRLDEVRQRLAGLSNHPSVQLSLEVKLARRRGHDLLAEMAEICSASWHKIAQRDYLRSQVEASDEG
jgi:hypothetical protein